MGKSVNRWVGLGNVGKDPEVKSTSGGTLVANFSIATTDRRKDSAGNWQDQTEWTNLVALGRTAEIVRDYVKKGSKLYVEGKLQTRSWEKDGQKHYRTEVLVNDLSLLSGKDEENRASTSRVVEPTTAPEIDDDEIPF